MCNTLIVEDNTTFRAMLKEILHSRFPTMKSEEEPDHIFRSHFYLSGPSVSLWTHF